MPQLIFKGIKITDVKQISHSLVDELQLTVGCPRDYFTLEAPASCFISDGEEISGGPLIQVNWFDRGQEVQDRTAAVITRHVQQAGYPQVDLFFVNLEKNRYYENGKHY
jgi:hypothetical protein